MLGRLFVGIGLSSVLFATRVQAQDARCGSYCLYVALKSLELGPSTFEELEQRLGDPERGGYTMEQLDRAARAAGAQTIAVQTTLDNLAARSEAFACIALVGDSHFMLLYDADRRKVWLCDPPGLKEMPRDTFRTAWSGKALLVGNSEFASEEDVQRARVRAATLATLAQVGGGTAALAVVAFVGRSLLQRRRAAVGWASGALIAASGASGCAPTRPAAPSETPADAVAPSLTAMPQRIDLGIVTLRRPDQTIEVSARLRNDGREPIDIEALVPSCACTSVDVEPKQVQPGQAATLRATIKLANSSEDAATQILVKTSRDTDRPVVVAVTWRPRNPLYVESPHLTLRSTRPGRVSSQAVPVRLVGLGLCGACRFDVATAHDGLDHQLQLKELPRGGHSAPSSREGSHIGDLRVRTRPNDREGSDRALMTIALNCGDSERARLDLPVAWSVVPAIGVSPRRLFLGTSQPGASHRKTLIFSAVAGDPFQIQELKSSSRAIGLEASNVGGARSPVHVLKVEITPPEASGAWSASIVVRTDAVEQPVIVIPVAGFVEG